MPQGYYTIEQWTRPKSDAQPQWLAILHLPFGQSLTAAQSALEQLGKPGFYRVVHTQRVIWAEKSNGKLRLRKSHAASPRSLDDLRQMFDRCGGQYPVQEVKVARRQQKKSRART